jgi:hypothetical protein
LGRNSALLNLLVALEERNFCEHLPNNHERKNWRSPKLQGLWTFVKNAFQMLLIPPVFSMDQIIILNKSLCKVGALGKDATKRPFGTILRFCTSGASGSSLTLFGKFL